MKRHWEKERDFWLDHFRQYHPGTRRNPDSAAVTPADCVAIPVPMNLMLPLRPPCMIWRWSLRGGGYGVLDGRGAHVIVFEQTRGRPLREEMQVNHLCNRPFCVQPAHLYEGTAQQNSEDRQAELDRGRYPTWQAMAHRLDRSMTRHHWPAPELTTWTAGWREPLECPHTEMPGMFEKGGTRGELRYCANCREVRTGANGQEKGEWRPCGMETPCRCGEKEGGEGPG